MVKMHRFFVPVTVVFRVCDDFVTTITMYPRLYNLNAELEVYFFFFSKETFAEVRDLSPNLTHVHG